MVPAAAISPLLAGLISRDRGRPSAGGESSQEPPMSPNKYPGVVFMALAFALGWLLMAYTTIYGVTGNTAQASGQSWAGSVILMVVSIYGGVAITDALSIARKGP
jgi:hypothetical protein